MGCAVSGALVSNAVLVTVAVGVRAVLSWLPAATVTVRVAVLDAASDAVPDGTAENKITVNSVS